MRRGLRGAAKHAPSAQPCTWRGRRTPINLLPGVSVDEVYSDPTYGYGPGGGAEPTLAEFFPQSAGFVFLSDPLDPDEYSDVLLFSSVHTPEDGFGTISGGGISQMGEFPTPSPNPEPATVFLVGFAGLFGLRRKRHNQG